MTKNLDKQAKEIIEMAKSSGVDGNYFFVTSFQRYQTQLKLLEALEKALDEEGILVEKTYIKDSSNLYANPAISQYNKCCDSANKTVATLMKIIKEYGVGSGKKKNDPLLDILNGSGE